MHGIQKVLFSVILISISCLKLLAQANEDELLNKAILLRQQGDQANAVVILKELALLYWDTKKYEKSVLTFEQIILLDKELDNQDELKTIYSNIGKVYIDMGQPESALLYFRKSLLICQAIGGPADVANNMLSIGTSLLYLNRNSEALENLDGALIIAKTLNDKYLLKNCYGKLATAHKRLGNNDKSVEFFALYSALQEKLLKQEIDHEKKKILERITTLEQTTQKAIEEKEETEQMLILAQDSLQKAAEINEDNNLQLQIKELAFKKQSSEKRFLIIIFVTVIFFISAITILILIGYRQKRIHNFILERRNEEIKLQNEEIKAKSHKINQSINYAKSIQSALLPDLEVLKTIFTDSFVFFSPRDVVSGDFYWFARIDENEQTGKGKIIVTAVDCTGHGVPGALMSMLGISFFDDLVIDKGLREPANILEQIHKMIKSRLNQDISGNSDGMDIGLCVYDEEKRTLTFAGAANPLIYIIDDKLETLQADVFGIGGQMRDTAKGFNQSQITINSPTSVYLFTDGFPDQFGGEKGRKYFLRNFKELLLQIHHEPMEKQALILEQKLKEWHGDEYPRVDDVLVIGFIIE
jgi:serine phosphatase RsbU (regulator of sigma subunit)